MGHMWVHDGEGGVAMVMVVAWPWVSGLRFLGLLRGGGVARVSVLSFGDKN